MATAKRAHARGKRTSVRGKVAHVSNKNPHPQPLPARGRGAKRAALAAGKPKGGPVPGTPSPMRTRLAPELQAHARRLYEETDQPVTHIALDCGVDESVLRRMGQREGWVRYVAPPRGLPPVATLLAEVEAVALRGAQVRAPQGDGVTPPTDSRGSASASLLEKDAPQDDGESAVRDVQKDIMRCTQVVMAHLDTFEDTRRNGRLVPKQHLANARAISILTEAFNKLQRLRADLSGPTHDTHASPYDDMPADPDEFRLNLARRIEAFLASRPDEGDAGGAAAVAPDPA